MTHCKLDSCVWNSRRIVGTARFKMVLSRTGIATDTIATDAANHRLGSSGSSIGATIAADLARPLFRGVVERDLDAPASLALGAVERLICARQETVGVGGAAERDPDARVDPHRAD